MLAKTMGWTLNYIDDELDWNDYQDTLAILDAVDKGQAYQRQRAEWDSERSRGGKR